MVRRRPALQQARGPGLDRVVAGFDPDRVGHRGVALAQQPFRQQAVDHAARRRWRRRRQRRIGEQGDADAGHAFGEGLQPDRGLVRIRRGTAAGEQRGDRIRQQDPRHRLLLQHASERMPARTLGPALEFLPPPGQLGLARARIPAGPGGFGQLVAQGEPGRRHFALFLGHEGLRHRPFRPVLAPLGDELRGGGIDVHHGHRNGSSRSAATSARTSPPHSAGRSPGRR